MPDRAPAHAKDREETKGFVRGVRDALADLDGCAVLDGGGHGRLAVIDLNRQLVWLLTVEEARFEVRTTDRAR